MGQVGVLYALTLMDFCSLECKNSFRIKSSFGLTKVFNLRKRKFNPYTGVRYPWVC